MPFLWIHGESAQRMISEIHRIHESGIGALCIEARPHDDFNGPKWFEDIKVIIEECKKLDMKVWLLDDSHFPTGFANGEVKKNYPELCKKYLCLKTYDFCGPVEGSGACITNAIKAPTDQILKVFLQKKTGFEDVDYAQTIDVTDTIHQVDDFNTGKQIWMYYIQKFITAGKQTYVNFDLPAGQWSLNVLTVSYKGGEKETEGYLNPLLKEGTQVLLDTVYEPIFEHFKDDFGKTFMGFFSDEPRFGNIHGAEDASIGRNPYMNLPWSDDLLGKLVDKCNEVGGLLADMTEDKLCTLLPYLFIGDTEIAHALRYAYMDLVSYLYSENFDGVIANWCHEHNVQRIGHCIEDNEAASRLGYGAGHLFRAMKYADMAGIDVVIHQVTPGFDDVMFKGFHKPGWDGEFFTYLLGKFGGSLAHLEPNKLGRCMCELFGAYGWAEGNRLMKWLADYMMVRGVNHLVPHAFDCADFPDADCPPHFYGEGKNPQYPEFRILMDYCNNVCDILNDGIANPSVALYFNAEGEWCGDYQKTQKPAALLARNCIDYDLISMDYILECEVVDKKLCINGMKMNALVLPWQKRLPSKLLEKVIDIAKQGCPVYFVDGLPKVCVGKDVLDELKNSVQVVALNNLVSTLQTNGCNELSVDTYSPFLRYYHYSKDGKEFYFYTNESVDTYVNTKVTGMKTGYMYEYNPFDGKLYVDNTEQLVLAPYTSKMVVISQMEMDAEEKETFIIAKSIELNECTVSIADMNDMSTYTALEGINTVGYISNKPEFETFGGRIRYTFQVELSVSKAQVELLGVYEGASVTVNGKCIGTRICNEYKYNYDAFEQGMNEIVVEVNTTLGRAMNDMMSSCLPMQPSGIKGVRINLE